MAKNPRLQDVVLTALNEVIQGADAGFAEFCDREEGLGKSVIESMGEVQVDKPYKLRMIFRNFLGYAYDFQASCDEGNPKETYERAVSNTEEMKGKPHMEQFVKKGITEDRYGWYVTTLPG